MVAGSVDKELIFDLSEYQDRIRRLKASMAKVGMDTFVAHTFENIFYLIGQQTTGLANYQCLVVPSGGDPFLVVRRLESLIAGKNSWISDFVIWEDHEDPVDVTIRALRERGLDRGTIGIEENSLYLSARSASMLRQMSDRTTLVDASGTVEQLRRIKSPRELDYIRETARITSAGMRAAIDEAGEGKTENDVAAAAVAAMYRAGSEFMAREPTVNSGPRSGIPHTSFRRRTMAKGDSILLEMSGCYNRYSAPLFRTVSIGHPSDSVRRMSDACIAALQAAIEVIKPGRSGGDVERAFSGAFQAHGFGVGKRAGYSIGIGFPPTWMETSILALKRDDDTVLEPGMALHIPAALRDPGVSGAGCSESLLVTDTGCEVITQFEQRLFVK